MTFLPLESFNISDALSTSGFGFLVVLCVLAVLMIFVKILSRIISGPKKNKISETNATPQADTVPAPVAQETPTQIATEETEPDTSEYAVPHTPGYVILDGVAEQDAAVIMAITSFRTGIDLERLSFKSIKRLNQDPVLENISEQDAATIMAITSNRTGIPLENLCFNSIKLVEE